MPGGQMPEPYFVSDKCQEDKCQDPHYFRTNARRTNAWTHIWPGQMPGGQMPEPTGPGICPSRHLSSRHLSVEAFVRPPSQDQCGFRHLSGPNVGSGICPPGICPIKNWLQAFVLLAFVRSKIASRHLSSWHMSDQKMTPGICPTKKCLLAFVLKAIIPPKNDSRHLSSWNLSVTKSRRIQQSKLCFCKTWFESVSICVTDGRLLKHTLPHFKNWRSRRSWERNICRSENKKKFSFDRIREWIWEHKNE